MARTKTGIPPITEKDWQAQVIRLAEMLGFKVYHTHDSRRSQAGFPDLCLVRAPRVLFAELKSEAGKLRPAQDEWRDELLACPGVEWYCWRPSQLSEVARILRRD